MELDYQNQVSQRKLGESLSANELVVANVAVAATLTASLSNVLLVQLNQMNRSHKQQPPIHNITLLAFRKWKLMLLDGLFVARVRFNLATMTHTRHKTGQNRINMNSLPGHFTCGNWQPTTDRRS